MTRFADPIAEGLAAGWKVTDASERTVPDRLECDVVIVGTGAGGGTSAEILARQGLDVVLVEEGPLKSTRDFHMREAEAYPDLYQESAARKTEDKSVTILQGRCVGGSTTVNWTSSFRTPPTTLQFWRERHALDGYAPEDLAPWFTRTGQRLSVGPWLASPNANNDALRAGAERTGVPTAGILRNVKGCLNLGYCGMGCPTNAKQSMLVTTVPAALAAGARMLTRARVERLIFRGGTQGRIVEAVEVAWLGGDANRDDGRRTVIRARHVVLAGGAINTPAMLLRSQAPDPHALTGRRTYLHPTVISTAFMGERIDASRGAPQTIYSDHFLAGPIDGPMGFKLEVPPLHPLLFGSATPGFGAEHAERMKRFPYTQVTIALVRDGFHPASPAGTVKLRSDGSPMLDYRLNDVFFDAARRAFLAMAEIQFAAGAREVSAGHEDAPAWRSWSEARAGIQSLALVPLATRVMSAHVMGGCALSGDERLGLVRPDGVHHHIDNLSVHDGSLFPTSIGANPQWSIYAITARLASGLAARLTGRPAT